MRREKGIEMVRPQVTLKWYKDRSLQDHIPVRISDDLFFNSIETTTARIDNPAVGDSVSIGCDLRCGVTLLLRKELNPIGDDHSKVPRACLIDARIEDLVQDPMADREPDPTVWFE
jgi:hypothetical protein